MEELQITPELEEKIRNSESLDEIVQLCTDAGIPVTKEQIEAGLKTAGDEELSETALDNVSGGGLFSLSVIIGIIWGRNRARGGGGQGSFGGGGSAGGR